MWIILLIMLAFYSYWDIREKQLPVLWIVVGILLSAVLGFGNNMQGEGMDVWRSMSVVLKGMIPGGLLALLSFVLKGKIGCGDGLVLIIITNMAGMESGLIVWVIAMALSFVYSCLLLIVRKKKKDYCFPFIPFYFLGAVAAYGIGLG